MRGEAICITYGQLDRSLPLGICFIDNSAIPTLNHVVPQA